MSIKKEVVCRIVGKDESGKKQFFSFTIYQDVRNWSPKKVEDRIKDLFL